MDDVAFLGGKNLERFVGDNSQISSMIIDNCKKLDLRTIQTFKGSTALTVNGCPQEIGLTEMGEFKELEAFASSTLSYACLLNAIEIKKTAAEEQFYIEMNPVQRLLKAPRVTNQWFIRKTF